MTADATILPDEPTAESIGLLRVYWPSASDQDLRELYTNLLACGSAAPKDAAAQVAQPTTGKTAAETSAARPATAAYRWRVKDEEGEDLIDFWKRLAPASNEVLAAGIIEDLERELADARTAFKAAIDFAIELGGLEGAEFLRLWQEGAWTEIAAEFPEFKRPA